MSGGGALRAAWEAAQSAPTGGLRAAWEAAQQPAGNQKLHDEYAVGNLGRRMASENATDAAESAPSYWQQALGGVAALARDIPGAEALQAGARALTRGQSYADARADIKSAEDAAPAAARTLNRIAGGAVSVAALPRVIGGKVVTPAMQGVLSGVAGGALQSDPDAGLSMRVKDAAVGGVVGGTVGKAADAATNLVRSGITSTLGTQALKRRAAMTATDAVNFGAAKAEAAANGGTTPAVQNALNDPRIKGLADDIRQSFRDQGLPTDDASVLMQVHRELTQNERALIDRSATAAGPRPMTDREQGDVQAVKKMLRAASAAPSQKPPLTLDVAPEIFDRDPTIVLPEREPLAGPVGTGPLTARTTSPPTTLSQGMRNASAGVPNAMQGPDGPAFQLGRQSQVVQPGVRVESPGMRITTAPAEDVPALMPSFPGAIRAHAEAQGVRAAGRNAADATRRLLSGSRLAAKEFEKKAPEAFLASVPGMSPAQADAALDNVFGRLKQYTDGSPNPLKAFGLGPALSASGKVTPFVQALEQQRGGAPALVDLLRAAFGAEGHPTP